MTKHNGHSARCRATCEPAEEAHLPGRKVLERQQTLNIYNLQQNAHFSPPLLRHQRTADVVMGQADIAAAAWNVLQLLIALCSCVEGWISKFAFAGYYSGCVNSQSHQPGRCSEEEKKISGIQCQRDSISQRWVTLHA